MGSTKPLWFSRPMPQGEHLIEVGRVLAQAKVHTVCQSALCPNLGECFADKTATFMIMGDACTRDCRFCAVETGRPRPLDPGEPARVTEAVQSLGLDHAVVTSVTRDDLPDGGARHFAQTVAAIRERNPGTTVEVLVPDFGGSRSAIETVAASRPDVIGHNVETVPRLYGRVRPGADYQRSLQLLRSVAQLDVGIRAKSGLMLGLGEERREVVAVMDDLLQVGCGLLTIGQYLRPSRDHLDVTRFVLPGEFVELADQATSRGFRGVAAGPFVRSSYRAGDMLKKGRVE